MKHQLTRTWIAVGALALGLALALMLAGCSDSSPAGRGSSTATLPAGLIAKGAVADAVPVGACKSTAKAGDHVTVTGRIGGAVAPFNAGMGIFTIVDPSLKSCADGSDPDHCETPWDYCCEPPDNLRRNMATIEIVGADGKVVPFSVKGAEGLQPLATIAVTGTVIERTPEGVFVVRAERISIHERER